MTPPSRMWRFVAQPGPWLGSVCGSRLFQIAQTTLSILALVFVGTRIAEIGTARVLASLPTHAIFYVLFAAIYVLIPVSEAFLYRRILPGVGSWADFFRKRAINEAVLDYTGEAFLFARLRRRLPNQDALLGSVIKDVNLLSGAVSNGLTVILLAAVALSGQLRLVEGPDGGFPTAFITATAIMTVLIVVLILFHRRLISVSPQNARLILSVHSGRTLLSLLAQLTQWHLVMPEVSLAHWILLLTVWLLITRIPFVPNRDLLLAGIAISLSGVIGAAPNEIAGMFVIAAILPLAGHVIVLASTNRDGTDAGR